MGDLFTPNWNAPTNIRAYTTARGAWGKANYKSLEERDKLKTLLNCPADPIWLNQTHTNIAIEAIPANQGKNADASYTSQSKHVCIVLTADCLPVLLCNQAGTKVAAIHAGWRGLANGILEATLKACPTESPWIAWLGPAISAKKFEVGQDVYDAFTRHSTDAASAFTPTNENKYLADLYALAKMRLQAQGVTDIYGGEYCTHTQADLFYSYRREKEKAGRMANAIWIE